MLRFLAPASELTHRKILRAFFLSFLFCFLGGCSLKSRIGGAGRLWASATHHPTVSQVLEDGPILVRGDSFTMVVLGVTMPVPFSLFFFLLLKKNNNFLLEDFTSSLPFCSVPSQPLENRAH